MNPHARQFILSIMMGAIITVTLIVLKAALTDYQIMRHIADGVLWSLALFKRLFPPPRLFRNGGGEGTPIQLIAVVAGTGIAWAFYSSIFLLVGRFCRRNIGSQNS